MKTTWLETCNEVYEHLQDDTSRDIFIHRLNYAVTRDKKHLVDMVRMLPEAKRLYSLPTQKSYIFGAGYYGQKTRKFLPMEWMGFIDNDNQKWGGTAMACLCFPSRTFRMMQESSWRIGITMRRYTSSC